MTIVEQYLKSNFIIEQNCVWSLRPTEEWDAREHWKEKHSSAWETGSAACGPPCMGDPCMLHFPLKSDQLAAQCLNTPLHNRSSNRDRRYGTCSGAHRHRQTANEPMLVPSGSLAFWGNSDACRNDEADVRYAEAVPQE